MQIEATEVGFLSVSWRDDSNKPQIANVQLIVRGMTVDEAMDMFIAGLEAAKAPTMVTVDVSRVDQEVKSSRAKKPKKEKPAKDEPVDVVVDPVPDIGVQLPDVAVDKAKKDKS